MEGKPVVKVPRYRMKVGQVLDYPLTKYQIAKITRQSYGSLTQCLENGFFKDLAARRLNEATQGKLEMEAIE